MENEKEARQARREKQISTAATLHFRGNGGGAVHHTRVNPAPAARQRNPTLVSREEIDGRAVSWTDRFVVARSQGARESKSLQQRARNREEKVSVRQKASSIAKSQKITDKFRNRVPIRARDRLFRGELRSQLRAREE
jgi:hypothetical protein